MTKSNNHKTKVWRYLKVLISKFCTAFNFNFYKKSITTTQNCSSFARGKLFLKQMLFHSLYKVSIGFGGRVFSKKMILGNVGEGGGRGGSGGQKIQGGNLP